MSQLLMVMPQGIKQDDFKDWKETAAQMVSIYENAFITLAATYAIDSNGGLFSADQDCTPKQLAERRDMYVRERKKGTGHAYCWYVEEYNSARFVLVSLWTRLRTAGKVHSDLVVGIDTRQCHMDKRDSAPRGRSHGYSVHNDRTGQHRRSNRS
jgi:hypothetical protein